MFSKEQLHKDLKDPGAWLLYLFLLSLGAALLFIVGFMYIIGVTAYASYGWIHLLIAAFFYFAFHHPDMSHEDFAKKFKRFCFVFALMFYVISYFISMTGIGNLETGAKVIELIPFNFPNGLQEALITYPFRMFLLLFSVIAHIGAAWDLADKRREKKELKKWKKKQQ